MTSLPVWSLVHQLQLLSEPDPDPQVFSPRSQFLLEVETFS